MITLQNIVLIVYVSDVESVVSYGMLYPLNKGGEKLTVPGIRMKVKGYVEPVLQNHSLSLSQSQLIESIKIQYYLLSGSDSIFHHSQTLRELIAQFLQGALVSFVRIYLVHAFLHLLL